MPSLVCAEDGLDLNGAWEDDGIQKGSLEVNNICEGINEGRVDGGCKLTMVSTKVWMMEELREAESWPMGCENVREMAEKMNADSWSKGSAKAQMMGSLNVALTMMVPAKAARKETLKVERTTTEPGRMMTFPKACWKSMAFVKAPTRKAEPT
jgi:hypothetical protein